MIAGAGLGIALIVVLTNCSSRTEGFEVIRKAKAGRGDLSVTISSTGEVKPQNRIEIKPSIAGRIEEVLVREGQTVKQGQILAWMSSSDRAALLDVARSQGPEAVQRWEDAYKRAPLVAPLDGTVILRAVEPGQTVTASEAVIVLADRLIVEALVDETDLALVKLEQPVEVRLDAYPGERTPAKVDHVAFESRIVNNVSMYPVDILPEKVPEHFRSGMTATLTFIVLEKKDVLLIPSEAVSEWKGETAGASQEGVFAVYRSRFGGAIAPVRVRLGETDGRSTEVLEGLQEGDEVLIVRRRATEKKTNPLSPNRSRSSERPRG